MNPIALPSALRVVVTGRAAGIGQVTADAFVAAGAKVFIRDADGTSGAERWKRMSAESTRSMTLR
jgi:NAD(P)-dependent dehydrogenase (short-subunit alcohol dehydrogenase family)